MTAAAAPAAIPEIFPGMVTTPLRAPVYRALRDWLQAVDACRPALPVFLLSGPKGVGKSRLVDTIYRVTRERAEAHIRDCELCGGMGMRPVVQYGPPVPRHQRVVTPPHVPCGCRRALVPQRVSTLSGLGKNGKPGLVELFSDEAGYERRAEARAVLDRFADCRLLIVDEVGTEKQPFTPTWEPGLIRLMDARVTRHTLLVSNHEDVVLAAHYEPRVVDRVLGAQVCVYQRLDGASWRHDGAVAP